MLAVPTLRAQAVFVGAVVLLVLACWIESAEIAALAFAELIVVAGFFAATLPLARRARRERLEFAWWFEERTGRSSLPVRGSPVRVCCYIRNPSNTYSFAFERLRPFADEDCSVLRLSESSLEVRSAEKTEFSFFLVAPSVGRWVLHGLTVDLRGPLGLFTLPLYFPNPLAFRVFPRNTRLSRTRASEWALTSTSRPGAAAARRVGHGAEIHELRDFKPGDPFRRIAWKASARAGKLVAKDVEDDSQQSLYLVVDGGGSFRAGTRGNRLLDWAIEWASFVARQALESGCVVGCCTVDHQLMARVPPQSGGAQVTKIYDALLHLVDATDAAQTGVSDDEVLGLVGRYVRQQHGVDFSDARESLGWNARGLAEFVARELSSMRDFHMGSVQESRLLRAFCKQRGLLLPFVKSFPFDVDATSLADAMGRAVRDVREPATFIVLADVATLAEEKKLAPLLRRMMSTGHFVRCIGPLRHPKTLKEQSYTTLLIQQRSQLCFAQQAKEWLLRVGVRLDCPLIDSAETNVPLQSSLKTRTRLKHVG